MSNSTLLIIRSAHIILKSSSGNILDYYEIADKNIYIYQVLLINFGHLFHGQMSLTDNEFLPLLQTSSQQHHAW